MTCKDCLSEMPCAAKLKEMYQNKAEKSLYLKNKADFVEVVRCKDCKHRSTSDFYSFYCGLQDVDCKDDDFCSCGERKKKNDFKVNNQRKRKNLRLKEWCRCGYRNNKRKEMA